MVRLLGRIVAVDVSQVGFNTEAIQQSWKVGEELTSANFNPFI